MKRISMRDLSYERNMETAYIDQLKATYSDYFAHYGASPVLTIDTNELDFVHRAGDLAWVDNRIRQALELAPFQPELPLEP